MDPELVTQRLARIGPLEMDDHTELVRRSMARQEAAGITSYDLGHSRLALPDESLMVLGTIPVPNVDYAGGVREGNHLEANHGPHSDPRHSGSVADIGVGNPNTGGLHRVTAYVPLDPSNLAITDPERAGAMFTASAMPTIDPWSPAGYAPNPSAHYPSMTLHTGPTAEMQALVHGSRSKGLGHIHTVNPRQFADFVMGLATGNDHVPHDEDIERNEVMVLGTREDQSRPFKPWRDEGARSAFLVNTLAADDMDHPEEAVRMHVKSGGQPDDHPDDWWDHPMGVQYSVDRSNRSRLEIEDAI